MQLQERNRLDPAMAANGWIISTGWPSMIMRPCSSICGVDSEDLDDMIAELKRADPQARPGLWRG
jgi:RNA polymerase sigma-54 factor